MNDERINFSENFAKSKRNLLWICTVIIFIYFANLPTVVEIKIADVNFPICRTHLIVLAAAYFVYLLLSYSHELYFSYRRNSQAGRTLEELDAKDFVERSIADISGSIELLKQNISDIANLKSNLPSDEPVAFETIEFSHLSLDSVRNSMSLVADGAQQRVQELTGKLIELYGRNEDVLNFSAEASRLFYTSAQQMVDNFLTAKLEMTIISKSNEVIEAKNRFDDRMNRMNDDLVIVKRRLEENSKEIRKSAQLFLGISNSVHQVSNMSFFVLDMIIPVLMSAASIILIIKILFFGG